MSVGSTSLTHPGVCLPILGVRSITLAWKSIFIMTKFTTLNLFNRRVAMLF